jgi:outer membrane protein assembly factor BamB
MANALQVFRLPKLSRLRNDLALFIGSFELNLVESSLRHGVLRSVCGSLLPRRVRVSRGRAFVAIALGLGGLFTAAQVTAQTAVLTRSHDNARTGANMSETVLTPAAVAAKGLSRVRGFVVDDDPRIEAQPLYLPHLTMPDGKAHDVLFVASMGNHIWAFDVDGNGTWKTPQLGAPFVPPEVPNQGHRSTTIDSWGINIAWGILSTPVIDLDANRIYCVNWMLQNGTPALFAHRIDIATMTEIGTPKPIEASLGADVDARGKPVKLQPDQKQRAALLLVPLRGEHKTLFVATTGGEDPGSPRGWMVAFDVDTFKQTAAWVSTPSSFGGGMWQGSQGPAADESGHVYAITGNGGYIRQHPNGVHDFNGTTDFAEAVVRLKYEKAVNSAALTLDDWFIPFRDSDRSTMPNYDYRDQDFGSAGPVLPPGSNLLLASGKDGILYVLNRDNLGKKVGDMSVLKSPPIYVTYNGVGLPVTSDIDFPLGDPTRNPSKTHHLHGSPVFWNGSRGPMIFTWGENESLRAWTLNLQTGAVSFVGKGMEVASAALALSPTGLGGMPGGMLAVSSNGQASDSGIVWALAPVDGDANHGVVEGIARAYDAATLDPTPIDPQTPRLKLLWDSRRSGMIFNHAKFVPPVVADGRLFVPTYDGRVDMYMLNP